MMITTTRTKINKDSSDMTKIAQFWDFIETSSFREDIKGIKDIQDNDDDYNDKEESNKNDSYDKDNKVDNKDYKYDKESSALGLDRDV